MRPKLRAVALLLGFASVISGCGFSPDTLPTFSRYGIAEMGGITRSVPIIEVEHAVQCEVKEFLESNDLNYYYDYKNSTPDSIIDLAGLNGHSIPNVSSAEISNNLLQFDQPAQITLAVKTDNEGKVTAAGVDFKKIGIGFLGNAVAKTSTGAPSFAAYLQGTGEVSAAPVAAIPQTSRDVWQVYVVAKDGSIAAHNLQVDNVKSRDLKIAGDNYSDEQKRRGVSPESSAYWQHYNELFNRKISGMLAYHKDDFDYSNFGTIASQSDFQSDYDTHIKNDASYHMKHQPTGYLIAGLHNIVCPGYPDYPKYDPLQLKGNNYDVPDAANIANKFEAVKYFSIKQWLFDFFTSNMVWEPDREVKKPVKRRDDIWRSHDLQFRRYLERAYLEPKAQNDVEQNQLLTVACQSKLTLGTQIVVSFDMNSGVAREVSPVYVLPMSLLTVDVNPSWTQNLQIQFVLHNSQNNDLCEKLLQIKPLGS